MGHHEYDFRHCVGSNNGYVVDNCEEAYRSPSDEYGGEAAAVKKGRVGDGGYIN